METTTLTLLHIGIIWAIAAIVPGPNFLIVIKASLDKNFKNSFFTVLGIVLGTITWASGGILGITILFKSAPWLYVTFKIVGAIYLIYLGVKLLLSSKKFVLSNKKESKSTLLKSFVLGFLTNLSNPKTAIFVGSLFSVAMPQNIDSNLAILSVITMASISLIWYSFVGFIIGLGKISTLYLKIKKQLDRVIGTAFILFGVSIIKEKI